LIIGRAACSGIKTESGLCAAILKYMSWPVLRAIFQIRSHILDLEDYAVSSELGLVHGLDFVTAVIVIVNQREERVIKLFTFLMLIKFPVSLFWS